jgi:CMP-N-acetylneuraminic acid synthetase
VKVTALLTGRGNNTLKDKNILDVLGKPVLYYIANSARKCPEISAWY